MFCYSLCWAITEAEGAAASIFSGSDQSVFISCRSCSEIVKRWFTAITASIAHIGCIIIHVTNNYYRFDLKKTIFGRSLCVNTNCKVLCIVCVENCAKCNSLQTNAERINFAYQVDELCIWKQDAWARIFHVKTFFSLFLFVSLSVS